MNKAREDGMLARYQAALKKAQERVGADPKDEKNKLNVKLYSDAIDNILKHGSPNGPKAAPHPGDANINW